MQKEPYYYLFNFGIASASVGLLLWLAFFSGLLQSYPIRAHGSMMFFAFLFSFVMGFLMTAVPRMTQSDAASRNEILTALALCLLHWVFGLAFMPLYSVAVVGLQLIFLLNFILQRIWKTKKIPFVGFIFLPFAFALAFLGVIHTLYFAEAGFKTFYILCGEAFILNLICGIGARLIPVIRRLPDAVNPDVKTEKARYSEYAIYALLLNSTYILEFFEYNQLAYGARAVFILIFAVYKFKIFHKPTQYTSVALGLQASIVGLFAGYFLLSLNVVAYLPAIHLVYIAGFTLLTIMIASRVSLAHGGKGTSFEINSTPIMITTSLLLLAAILRTFLTGSPQILVFSFAILGFLTALWTWKFKHL